MALSPDTHDRLMKEDVDYKVKWLEDQLERSEMDYEEAFKLLVDEGYEPEILQSALVKLVHERRGGLL